jgi:hypothetical protein
MNMSRLQHAVIQSSVMEEHSKNCPPSTVVFTGRGDILKRLQLYYDPSNHIRGPRIFVLTGMGGIGKSQIAYRFIEKSQDEPRL